MAVTEPVLNVDQIQGNILAGFNKDYQSFLLLRIRPSSDDLTRAKRWLRDTLKPALSTTSQVLAFNRAYHAAVVAGTTPPQATWVNAGFSAAGLRRLVSSSAVDQFADDAFKLGLHRRSEFLGDPTDPASPGNRRNWRFGGTAETEPDIVVIVASDDDTARHARVAELEATLAAAGLELVSPIEHGATFGAPWRGHEHFGFKDGVSQPGVRGRASSAADDFITRRTLRAVGGDDRHLHFGKPGQPLLWPGEFIIGEPRQFPFDTSDPAGALTADPTGPAPAAPLTPSWIRDGSFRVIRRLRQDFAAFWAFARNQAADLGMSPDLFAAMLVGRWKSGAPLMRSPFTENTALGMDEMANNHFAYNRDSTPVVPADSSYTDSFEQARSDFLGEVCPHYAHIRKVNPRDGATDLGVAQDTATRALLRRGIPYGESLLDEPNPTPAQLAADRGLIFVSYQASIVDQFETLIRRWTNTSNQPTPGGHDPVIGQGHAHQTGRQRFIDVPGHRRCFLDRDWVTPTGGGYFFAPAVDVVATVLGG